MKEKRPAKAGKIVLYVLLALLCIVTCVLSIRPAGFRLGKVGVGVYGCVDGEGIIPDGSMIISYIDHQITDGAKIVVFERRENSAYPPWMESALVGEASFADGKLSVTDKDGNKLDASADKAESIAWSIGYIGLMAFYLFKFRFILWGVWAAIVVLIIVIETSRPAREFEKEKKELIAKFEFYGEKFAEDEKGKNY